MASPATAWLSLPAMGRRSSLLLALVLCACSMQGTGPETLGGSPADPWQRWASAFDQTISACVRAGEADCLPRAFSVPRPPLAAEPSASAVLYRDLRTADVLLRQEDAAALLARQYGIDAESYLGTGYSVPVTGPGAYDYEYATQREFFVPNLCGDPGHCAPPDRDLWVWKLSPGDVAPWLDRPMSAFTREVPPVFDRSGFTAAADAAARRGARAGDGGVALPLLVRFAIFPASAYAGMVGRPDAERVFFADLELLGEGTLREALVGTGSGALVALAEGEADPAHTFFMWVHRPGTGSGARPATWGALFDALEERRPPELALRR